jgi:gluconate 5-dehydrogenase
MNQSLMNHFSLDGKLALVTGGSRGLGLGAARALGQSGARLILTARSAEALAPAAAELRAANIEVATSPFDLLDTTGIAGWYDALTLEFGQPDILVNSAGITRRAPAHELTMADWNEVISLNATATFELSRAFARNLIAAGRKGKIINLASLLTNSARKGTASYTASKGAVGQLTKALAIDWAQYGILVNAVAPGYIDTDINEALINDPEFDAWVKKRCPLGRWGTPEDIAWPIVFLASPAADFITGQILYVDGGWLSTF